MRMSVILGFAGLLVCQSALAGEVSDKPQCQSGVPQCVHHVIQEMQKRFKKLSKKCDHDAIFSLVYLRTTEKYQETLNSIGYGDPASVTREDALFADYYFRAFDAYHSNSCTSGDVPLAWQIAFDAASNRAVAASGNAFLGINAHIQRDLPFVLYELNQRGTPVSYEDHTLVNTFLAQVDVAAEVIEYFDPTYPLGGDSSLIVAWRELAWQNYQRLKNAGSAAARAVVAEEIEAAAAAAAQYFAAITAYPPGMTSAERDAYCEDAH